ncbi:MAG: YwiC-like family protein [Anaerolineales bacterium]|nr:YwiC-like family protein [Anaerolineales bacterium]
MNKSPSKFFRKQIFLPQDHGSWVFLLSPLLIGLFAGGRINQAAFFLVIAALSVFMLRQPASIAVKALTGRRPRTDLAPSILWTALYGMVALLAVIGLVYNGYAYLLLLAIPGGPVFAWHLYLVSKHKERRQAGIEIIASGVLALTAPAACWIGQGYYSLPGWYLWLFVWLQSAASIVYAYLRLEQREWSVTAPKGIRVLFQHGKRAFLYTSFNLVFAISAGLFIPEARLIFIPYLLQWGETLWGITHPSINWKPTEIGVRQLVFSTLFTILFIIFWRTT